MGELFQPRHLLVIGVVLLLVFGGKKLPELGKGLGEGLRGFKEGVKGISEDDAEQARKKAADERALADARVAAEAKAYQEAKLQAEAKAPPKPTRRRAEGREAKPPGSRALTSQRCNRTVEDCQHHSGAARPLRHCSVVIARPHHDSLHSNQHHGRSRGQHPERPAAASADSPRVKAASRIVDAGYSEASTAATSSRPARVAATNIRLPEVSSSAVDSAQPPPCDRSRAGVTRGFRPNTPDPAAAASTWSGCRSSPSPSAISRPRDQPSSAQQSRRQSQRPPAAPAPSCCRLPRAPASPAAISQIATPATSEPISGRTPGEPSCTIATAAGIAAASSPLTAAEAPIAPRDSAM